MLLWYSEDRRRCRRSGHGGVDGDAHVQPLVAVDEVVAAAALDDVAAVAAEDDVAGGERGDAGSEHRLQARR